MSEGEDERILCPEERALSVVVAMAPLDIRSKPEEDALCFELARKGSFDAFPTAGAIQIRSMRCR